jgi:hypothetical protein
MYQPVKRHTSTEQSAKFTKAHHSAASLHSFFIAM